MGSPLQLRSTTFQAGRGQVNTRDALDRVRAALNTVIRGKEQAVDLLLVGVLAAGHVLIEDVPGLGKTTLAKALARVFGLRFTRVQFTADLLPSDVLGGQVLRPREGTLEFVPGPIFTQLLLADEINRATPRTQSALLEAMSEGQVSTDGITRSLGQPFLVLATQNPGEFQGTFALPEAQLDRFLLRIHLGYPDLEDELAMLVSRRIGDPLDDVGAAADPELLLALQHATQEIVVHESVARYLLALVTATRRHSDVELGASPRGALALFRAAQAHALLCGRHWAGPLDVQQVARAVLAHRLVVGSRGQHAGRPAEDIIDSILTTLPIPA